MSPTLRFRDVPLSLLLLGSVGLQVSCSSVPVREIETPEAIVRLDGSTIATNDLDRQVADLMKQAVVPGLSLALVQDGEIVYRRGYGVKRVGGADAVDVGTTFSGLSFSKTVTSYLTLRLVDRGVLELDRPLVDYLATPVAQIDNYSDLVGDRRIEAITARHVLSHTTGWPNWRWFTDDGRLAFIYEPGERFSYSGEGFAFLQLAIETATGRDLDSLAEELIFEPLEMEQSSFVWLPRFEENYATDHDRYGKPIGRRKWEEAGAAGSLETTAVDYAKFLLAVMEGRGLSPRMRRELIAPQVKIEHQRMFGPLATERLDEPRRDDLSWGLGWGVVSSDYGKAIFHTGNDRGSANYHLAYPNANPDGPPGSGTALVVLANSQRFESIAPAIFRLALGDEASPFDYLGYVPYDAPSYEWTRRLTAQGFDAGMAYFDSLTPDERRDAGIEGEPGFLRVGRDLLGFDRPEVALQTYREAIERFGETPSVLEGMARSHLALGASDRAATTIGQARLLVDADTEEARNLRWIEEWMLGQHRPVEVPTERLATYAGVFGPRHVALRDGALYYFRDGADAADYRRLLAISTDTFVMAEIEEFRLRFETDESGAAVRIIGLYQDGDQDVSERTAN